MKKTISLILVLVLCLSLCACGGSDGFDAEYTALIQRISALNEDTRQITNVVYSTWRNVGVSDFNTFFGALRSLPEGKTLDDVKYTSLGAAACCLFPSQYWDDDTDTAWNLRNAVDALQADSAKAQKVLDAAIEFNKLYNSLSAEDAALSADFKAFRDQFEDKHADEVKNLREWVLESSMFVECALKPSGSLIEYGSSITAYEENLTRFSKIANSY